MAISDILKWENEYDNSKYPYELYKELVVEGGEHQQKFEIMGAWKTGCLKECSTGGTYCDKYGQHFIFSERWKESTPVGYKIWQYISNNQEILKEQVPATFPNEEPILLTHLKSFNGFGFIWGVFALHCWYPEIYPLYDQHVYRAFKYIISGNKELSEKADLSWDGYDTYRNFFVQMVKEANIDYWRLDKALWAYGKNLKTQKSFSQKSNKPINPQVFDNTRTINKKNQKIWLKSKTLGPKAKSFDWRLTNTNDIIIKRKFKGDQLEETTITKKELDEIDQFVRKIDWMDLANNVEKLRNGTEKEGFGWFLFNKLGKSTTESQLSSHLGAILVDSEVWGYNGKKVGLKFRKTPGDWLPQLRKFYESEIS
ncbi:hypothetical protein [Marinilabilia salmonicolor]|uniref:hypothetical protein n=1 Tax=Marinilabilia salmonicolor TaxID=989 RepID=UPI00029A0E2D|nr:hypothetical protein [Marinilabilia salmonicolor]